MSAGPAHVGSLHILETGLIFMIKHLRRRYRVMLNTGHLYLQNLPPLGHSCVKTNCNSRSVSSFLSSEAQLSRLNSCGSPESEPAK